MTSFINGLWVFGFSALIIGLVMKLLIIINAMGV